jgi:purine-binding chemotaxis protein CheW
MDTNSDNAATTPSSHTEAVGQYVTFYVEKESFAFPLASVLEIIRVPETVKVPMAPKSLVGLANLRGSVLPVLDLRQILAFPQADYSDSTRVVVTDVGTPVGLVVDRVAQVLNVERDKIESTDTVQSTVKADLLTGVVKDVGGRSLVQLLDVQRCVSLEFAAVVESARKGVGGAGGTDTAELGATSTREEAEKEDDSIQIVSFVVDDQEYAFCIAEVQEIVRVPENVSRVPRADANVIGIINLRNRLLPLVAMRRIFGLAESALNENCRILVVTVGGENGHHESVGIVVDQVREVLRVDPSVRDQVPALLTKNGVESQIESVCRLDDGKRLVSVISAKALFQHHVVQTAMENTHSESDAEGKQNLDHEGQEQEEDENRLVVFHLAEQEYGVIVDTVQEIIRVPDEMSRVPKTEEYIQGMVNLRGSVLPVLDMRIRFGMKRAERNDRQRILVLNEAGQCTGFIVDSVSEVLRVSHGAIEKSPRLSDEQNRIVGRVANLKEEKRMIQILDAHELVSDVDHSQILDKADSSEAASATERRSKKKRSERNQEG